MWTSFFRWFYRVEWKNSNFDKWFRKKFRIKIQWMQLSAKLSQIEFVVVYEKKCLCLSFNDSARFSESFSRSKKICQFRCRSDRVFRRTNHWWIIFFVNHVEVTMFFVIYVKDLFQNQWIDLSFFSFDI